MKQQFPAATWSSVGGKFKGANGLYSAVDEIRGSGQYRYLPPECALPG
jgi:hypothetical protein